MYNIVMAVTAGWGSTPNCIEGIQYTYIHYICITTVYMYTLSFAFLAFHLKSRGLCGAVFRFLPASRNSGAHVHRRPELTVVLGSGFWLGFAEAKALRW